MSVEPRNLSEIRAIIVQRDREDRKALQYGGLAALFAFLAVPILAWLF